MKFEKSLKEGSFDSPQSISPEERSKLLNNIRGTTPGAYSSNVVYIELKGTDDERLSKSFGREAQSRFGDQLFVSSARMGNSDITSVVGKAVNFTSNGKYIDGCARSIAMAILPKNEDFVKKLANAMLKISISKVKYSPDKKIPYDITYDPNTKVITVSPDIR